MANSEQIQYYINMINTAVRGEDVRNAIVELLKMANSDGVNAYTLNGLSADKFAKQTDMNTILPLSAAPTENGTRPVSSGGLYTYLQSIVDAINIILRDDNDGSISSKIQDIAEIRWDIMTALNEKGQTTYTTDKFDTFAGKIRNMPVESNFETETLDVSENGDYVPAEGHAYTTVSVDVQPTLKTKTITELGTFKAKDDDAYGFSEVTVSLSSGGGGGSGSQSLKLITKNIRSEDLPDTPEAKTFKAVDDEAIGYSEVTVDVGGKLGEKPIEVDPSKYDEITYNASDDDLYGYSSVKITVIESQGPFSVEFWNGSTKVGSTVQVEKHQNAKPTADVEVPHGKMFVGWSPNPVNVVYNMKCFAQFKDEERFGPGDEIQETWEEIAANGGSNIDIGAYKRLYYGPFTYDGVEFPGGSLLMYKVASGEQNTTSTWVSHDYYFLGQARLYTADRKFISESSSSYEFKGWQNSDLKDFLNNEFINALMARDDAEHGYQGALVQSIQSVTKFTNSRDADLQPISDQSSCGIWIPSRYEWRGPDDSDSESRGTYYNPSSIWPGSMGDAMTRTQYYWGGGSYISDSFGVSGWAGKNVGIALRFMGGNTTWSVTRYDADYIRDLHEQKPGYDSYAEVMDHVPMGHLIGFCT